jgi:hypothetical protein
MEIQNSIFFIIAVQKPMAQVKGRLAPLYKGGSGGILCNGLKIPLNPPL